MNGIFDTITRLFSGVVFWVIVSPWEMAIRVRLGKHTRKLGPGIHLKLPIVDVVYKQSVRLRVALLPTQTVSTVDGHTAVVGATVSYTISDVEALYQKLHHAEDTVVQIAAAELTDIVTQTAKADISVLGMGNHITKRLAPKLEAYGLSDILVCVTDFAFVKTFRLVSDHRYQVGGGDTLNTTYAAGR